MRDRQLVPLALAALLTVSVAGAFLLLPGGTASQATIRIVVQSDNPATLAELKAELEVKHDFGDLGFSALATTSTLEKLQSRPDVTAWQAFEYGLPVTDVPTEPAAVQENKVYARPDFLPPNIERVHAPAAWAEDIRGEGIQIGFVDTGLDVEHPDFEGSIFLCADVTASEFSMTDTEIRGIREGECTDYVGHGTHVAGTAAANGGTDDKGILGVAREAEVGMAKVCPGFICLEDDIAVGILLVADRGADVISISLGGSEPSPIIHAAILDVVDQGVVVVAAAGNSGPGADTIGYPAAFPEVVAVAATENLTDDPKDDTELYTRVTDFSSRGVDDGNDRVVSEREVELATPGRTIFSTCDGSFDIFVTGYCTASGTSMATPHVSGLVALTIQARGGEDTMEDAGDVQEVREIWISNTGTTTFDITEDCCDHAEAGYDIASGYGLPEMDLILDFLEAPGQGGGSPGGRP